MVFEEFDATAVASGSKWSGGKSVRRARRSPALHGSDLPWSHAPLLTHARAWPHSQAAPSVSEVTTIEYNRWLVEEDNKKEAEERKQKHDAERAYRKEQTDMYVKVGHDHSMEYKDQMETAKREVDNFRKHNLEKGGTVKAEVEALNKTRKAQKEQWIEHGSSLVQDLGSEQKRRIKKELGATSTRKRETSQALRKEMTELEKMRTERRNQAVENRKTLKEQVHEDL